MNISGRHIAILVHNYFEQAELEDPMSALKDAGADVTVISTDRLGLRGMNDVKVADKFTADLLLDQASSVDYDALIFPGGAVNIGRLSKNPVVLEWLGEFLDSGRPVGLTSYAPFLLLAADIVDGRRVTGFHTLESEIKRFGGDWLNLPVVVDENLITSRQPDDLSEFSRELIVQLLGEKMSAIDMGDDTIAGRSEYGNEQDARLMSLGYNKFEDELDIEDEADILGGEDFNDEEALHPSSLVPSDEQDGAY